MAVQYRIVNPDKLVVSYAEGVVTFDDLRVHQQCVATDPHFESELSELFVFSSEATFDLRSDGMREFARTCCFAPAARRAFFAPRDHLFAIIRMYQSWLGDQGEGMRVFRTLEKATSWLGIEQASLSGMDSSLSEIHIAQKGWTVPDSRYFTSGGRLFSRRRSSRRPHTRTPRSSPQQPGPSISRERGS